jgi:hypothetical protein
MLYPEERLVSEKEIRNWLSDAIANGEVDNLGDYPIDVNTVDIDIAMEMLDNFTFARF